jgi:recombination protein RecR
MTTMKALPPSIEQLIREFNKLPGIGSKTSERFVFHLLRQQKIDIDSLVHSLQQVRDTVRYCNECYTYTESEYCSICSNPQRDKQVLCVVADAKDVIAFEKTGQFTGRYHVLGGVIDNTIGMSPEQLRIRELLTRIDRNNVTEVVIATNPDAEGDITALYIHKQLAGKPVTVTRIARGLPMGADIDFADEVTLGNALEGRQKL